MLKAVRNCPRASGRSVGRGLAARDFGGNVREDSRRSAKTDGSGGDGIHMAAGRSPAVLLDKVKHNQSS